MISVERTPIRTPLLWEWEGDGIGRGDGPLVPYECLDGLMEFRIWDIYWSKN